MKKSLLFTLFLVLSAGITSTLEAQKYTPEDGWQKSSLQQRDIDSALISRLFDKINDNTYENIHSLLIVKDGYLALEEYFEGYTFQYDDPRFRGTLTNFNSNSIHNMASVTKSVTGLLMGIAIGQGLIEEVRAKAIDFFPGYEFPQEQEKKINQITLHHFLSMTSGLQWNEADIFYSEIENDIIQLFIVPDPVNYILSKPVIHEPGTHWYYNGGGTNLLGEIIHVTSELTVEEFAGRHLFAPLQITDYKWEYINPKIVYASGNIQLRPRDMAKLGYLVLNDGVWNDQRILSSEWIQKMVTTHWSFSETSGYGYQWWLKTFQMGTFSIDAWYASGWGGQYIYVFPGLDAVVVFTGGNYDRRDPDNEILHRYLLPSLIPNYKERADANDLYEFELIQKDAAITEDINIVSPKKNLTDNLKAFSGHWFGRWDYTAGSASQLVVEKIDEKEADILYVFTGYNTLKTQATVIESQKFVKIEFNIGSATLTYEYDDVEEVLVGYFREGGNVSKIVMKRKK